MATRYGHLAGDDCLRAIASQIRSVIRRPADLPARYGGEEFVLLMPETNGEGALHVARHIRTLVQDLAIPHTDNPPAGVVTISIGLASCSPDFRGSGCSDIKGLLSAADAGLYRAKKEGRNRVECAESP